MFNFSKGYFLFIIIVLMENNDHLWVQPIVEKFHEHGGEFRDELRFELDIIHKNWR